MKRCALYVRVSTEEQKRKGLSVDNQITALKEYCDSKGYIIIDTYNDAGISARKTYKKRPELLRMISDCQAGKIDLVIFTRLDRFFRSVPDYYACIEQMNNIPWRAIWEDYETETSAGVFKVNIMLSIAQAEADRTSEKIKSVLDYKKANGDFLGHPPFGYKIKDKKLIIDEEKQPAIQAFFNAYLNTFSISKSVYAFSPYMEIPHRDTLNRILRNPTYTGRTRNGGECPAYITEEEFEQIQRSFRVKAPNIKKHEYFFSGGLFVCARCGNTMIGSSRRLMTAQGYKDYKYYACHTSRSFKCDNKETISEKRVEAFLLNNLDEVMRKYNERIEVSMGNQDVILKNIEQLNAKLRRIGDRYEDGNITKEEYTFKSAAVKKEIREQEVKLKPLHKKTLPDDWTNIYSELDDTHRRAFWYKVLTKIEFEGGDEPLRFEL